MKRVIGLAALVLLAAVATSTPCTHTAHAQEPASTPPGDTASKAEAAQPSGGNPAAQPTTEPTKRVVDYKNPTLDDILDAWKQREKKVKNIKIVWDQEFTRLARPKEFSDIEGLREMFPEKETTQRDKGASFAFEDDMFSYVSFLIMLKDCTDEVLPSWDKSDGVNCARYSAKRDPDDTGSGIIHRRQQFAEIGQGPMAPTLALYRPLYQPCREPRLLSDSDSESSSLGLTISMDGSDPNTRIVTITTEFSRYTYTVQLEPGFPVTGIQVEWKGAHKEGEWSKTMETKVVIEKHDVAEFAPKEWTTVAYLFDQMTDRIRCKTTSFSVNTELPDAEFDPLAFPVGTRVYDRRRGPEFSKNGQRLDGEEFWQRENGVLEPIEEKPSGGAQD